MKIFISRLLIITGLVLLFSCGTVEPINRKLIVGSWKFDKVVTYTPHSTEAGAIEAKKIIKESVSNNDYSALGTAFPEMIIALDFRGDKTVLVTTHKTSFNGTWKINKTGEMIKVTAGEPKKITQIELKNVDNKSLEIVDPLSEGNLGLLFRKK